MWAGLGSLLRLEGRVLPASPSSCQLSATLVIPWLATGFSLLLGGIVTPGERGLTKPSDVTLLCNDPVEQGCHGSDTTQRQCLASRKKIHKDKYKKNMWKKDVKD